MSDTHSAIIVTGAESGVGRACTVPEENAISGAKVVIDGGLALAAGLGA